MKRLISYYKPHRKIFWADMFFAAVAAAASLVIPLIVRYITGTLIYEAPEVILNTIWKIAILLAVILAVSYYSQYFIGYYGHIMGSKIEYKMREEIFDHLQKLSFSFYDDQKVGQLMSRITSDLFEISELMHHGPENVILSVLKILGAFAILLTINGWLALAAFVILPFMFWFAYKLNRKMRDTFRVNRKKIGEINEQIEDNLAGIRVVKSFANEDVEHEKFQVGNLGFLAAKKNNYKYMAIFHGGIGVFSMLIQILVILLGCVLIAYGHLSVTDLVTFLLYINIFTEPIRTLVDFTEQFQNGYTGFERFCEIMDIHPDIEDAPDAVDLANAAGRISFEDVTFRYNAESEKVLSHVNLEIPAGKYVALVGTSGAGKTTLCSLIPRFYDVNGGSVKVDGVDVRKLHLKSLRDRIGIVQQDVYLFAGSICENIAYGKPGASREEIIRAAKDANAHDFIMSFPDGYDTNIGQRGVKLSGGQKQRLAIARVFLKNPPILILDEATSALDNESEHVVQESLEKLAKNRTTLVIAHRLTTIRNAEEILVLTEEGIAETGTHEELLQKGGIYAGLYHMH